MSRFKRNIVYDAIYRTVMNNYPDAEVSATYTPTPSKFPAVFAYEIGRMQNPSGITLAVDDTQYQVTWEVQVISNKADDGMSQAFDIMDTISDAMRLMYFIEISNAPIGIEDETKFRVVARFRRTIGGGDIIPTPVN